MITAENTIAEMTDTEIAAQRDMQRKIFILWQAYLAAASLHTAMLDKPSLFDDEETDALYETCRDLEDAHTKLDETYHRLYQQPGTEEN